MVHKLGVQVIHNNIIFHSSRRIHQYFNKDRHEFCSKSRKHFKTLAQNTQREETQDISVKEKKSLIVLTFINPGVCSLRPSSRAF